MAAGDLGVGDLTGDDATLGFDAGFYRDAYADLRSFPDDVLLEHFILHGIDEGRQACRDSTREGFASLLPTGRPILEIGPFANPFLRGPDVRYADALTTEQLRARATKLGLDPDGCPPISYPTLDLRTIRDRFHAVLSCHCIEHQPDLVRHLQAVEGLLEPGGSYFLIIPDKRFCFDYFLPESTIADVMTAYARQSRVHELGKVIEHWSMITHNDSFRHWNGDHGALPITESRDGVRRAIAAYEARPDGYIDVHAWQFTPRSFRMLVRIIAELGLSRLRLTAIHPTVRPRNEFCAVLSLPA